MPATPTATQAPISSKLTEGNNFLFQKLGAGLIIKACSGSEKSFERFFAFIQKLILPINIK